VRPASSLGNIRQPHRLAATTPPTGKDGGIDVNRLMELADVALEEEEEERELQ